MQSSWFDYLCLQRPALCAAFIGALSSLIIILLSDGLNADATQYLVAADMFKQSGWAAAEQIYERPFYPALLGVVSQLSHTSPLFSAYLLNIILAGLMGFAFVRLIAALGGDLRSQWIAAFALVLFPTLSDYRDYLIRDFGYWAFSLLGLVSLIRYQQRPQLLPAAQWLIYCGLATLFRPEALLIMVIVPLSLLLPAGRDFRHRLLDTLKLYGVLVTALITALGIDWLLGFHLHQQLFNTAVTPVMNKAIELQHSLASFTQVMETEILNRHSREYAGLSVFLVLSGIFVASLLSTLTPVIVLTGLYLWKTHQWQWPRNPSYWGMLLVTTLILASFLMFRHFMQSRYMVLAAVLLLVPLCFGLGRISQQVLQSRGKKYLAISIVSLMLIDNHFTLYSNKHEQQALDWLHQHASPNAWIYANEHHLAYFSQLTFSWKHILFAKRHLEKERLTTFKGYDYVVINADHNDATANRTIATLTANHFTEEARFHNKRNDQVVILSNPQASSHRHQANWQNLALIPFKNPN